MIPVHRYVRRRWYHGTSPTGAQAIRREGFIRPGLPTKYRQDIPRFDAVYVTARPEQARVYAGREGTIFEVELDETKLIPDEDVVFEILDAPKDELHMSLLKAWKDYNFGVYGDNRPLTLTEARQHFHFLAEKNVADPFTVELAEEMKDFTDWLVLKRPKLAKRLTNLGWSAAHVGPVKVKHGLPALKVRVRNHLRHPPRSKAVNSLRKKLVRKLS